MKRIFAIIMTSLILVLSPAFVSAAEGPVEMPDIKFIVNNQLEKLKGVPLEIGGKPLLPLTEALASLGVPNKHIETSKKDNSVTVINGGKTIYLKLGSKTARINGTSYTLDTAPLRYARNQKIYVPVRFLSNIVDKVVAWDADTRSVLIRDRDKYSEMKSILNSIGTAMSNVKRVRLDSKMKLDLKEQVTKLNFEVSVKEELDRKAGLIFSVTKMPLFGKYISFTSFCRNNTEYVKGPSSKDWKKTIMKESDFKALLSEDVSLTTINNMEVMALSLDKLRSQTKGEYRLVGRLYSKGFASNIGGFASNIYKKADISNLVPENYLFEAVIDKGTNLVSKLHAEFNGKAGSGNSRCEVAAVIDVGYSDYDGKFEVKRPNDLKE